jgi:hypothetical protein
LSKKEQARNNNNNTILFRSSNVISDFNIIWPYYCCGSGCISSIIAVKPVFPVMLLFLLYNIIYYCMNAAIMLYTMPLLIRARFGRKSMFFYFIFILWGFSQICPISVLGFYIYLLFLLSRKCDVDNCVINFGPKWNVFMSESTLRRLLFSSKQR